MAAEMVVCCNGVMSESERPRVFLHSVQEWGRVLPPTNWDFFHLCNWWVFCLFVFFFSRLEREFSGWS